MIRVAICGRHTSRTAMMQLPNWMPTLGGSASRSIYYFPVLPYANAN